MSVDRRKADQAYWKLHRSGLRCLRTKSQVVFFSSSSPCSFQFGGWDNQTELANYSCPMPCNSNPSVLTQSAESKPLEILNSVTDKPDFHYPPTQSELIDITSSSFVIPPLKLSSSASLSDLSENHTKQNRNDDVDNNKHNPYLPPQRSDQLKSEAEMSAIRPAKAHEISSSLSSPLHDTSALSTSLSLTKNQDNSPGPKLSLILSHILGGFGIIDIVREFLHCPPLNHYHRQHADYVQSKSISRSRSARFRPLFASGRQMKIQSRQSRLWGFLFWIALFFIVLLFSMCFRGLLRGRLP